MKLTDKLAEIGCKTDDKARRVSNVAPQTIADISAEALEAGVTLEQLDKLNVPVLRYGTQLTIHGTLPAFNANARPGGYRAVFLNKNGSVGVRYSAVDAKKKTLIARACKVAGPWHANATSAGFSIERMFHVRDEAQREQIKADCLAAMRSIPTDLFYGSAYAFALPYGSGYACGAVIGAVPEADLWSLIERLTGVISEAAINCAERIKEEEHQAYLSQWKKKWEAAAAENQARLEMEAQEFREKFLPSISGQRLSAIEKRPQSFRRYYPRKEECGTFKTALVEIAKRGPRLCFRTSEYGRFEAISDKKWLAWNEAAKRGEIFVP